ncbi:MAG: type II secretion system protein [Deltaproteobacteria bacterium]|nr:type II secretion system protein [Deltaproteobacteria bacterium]
MTSSIYKQGFTLLEILIAIFIFASVLSTIFISYTGTYSIIDQTESRASIHRMARIALERMQEDLESVYFISGKEKSKSEDDPLHSTPFVGKNSEIDGRAADTLSFLSTAHVVFDEEEKNPGIAGISYYVQESDNGDGLILYRSDTPEFSEAPEEGAGGLILCDGLFSTDFTYYDGDGKPHDSWDSTGDEFKNKFPVMVVIELSFIDSSDPESPVKFISGISLPMGRGTYEKAS